MGRKPARVEPRAVIGACRLFAAEAAAPHQVGQTGGLFGVEGIAFSQRLGREQDLALCFQRLAGSRVAE